MNEQNKCWVVPCVPCDNCNMIEESPNGCCNCGMLEWLCFETKEKAVEAFKNEYKEKFDKSGNYIC